MADVGPTLDTYRPVGVVNEVAAVGDVDRPGHLYVVSRTDHELRVVLECRQVGAVRCVIAWSSCADRPPGKAVVLVIDIHVMLAGARNDDQRRPDGKVKVHIADAVDAGCSLDAVEIAID